MALFYFPLWKYLDSSSSIKPSAIPAVGESDGKHMFPEGNFPKEKSAMDLTVATQQQEEIISVFKNNYAILYQ